MLQSNLPDCARAAGALPRILHNYEDGSNYDATIKVLDLTLTDVSWGAFTIGYNQNGSACY